jgi:predicted Zn-dependent protease
LSVFHTAVISLGKIDAEELRLTTARVAKLLRTPLEIRGQLPVPQAAHDTERGQYRASEVMKAARAMAPQLGSGDLVGIEGDAQGKSPLKTDGYLFVTDVDLFTANTDGVFSALISRAGLAVSSVRRLRESFYRRTADLNKQRSRLVKEMARMGARLRGAKECSDPKCVLAASKHLADLDLKEEKFCRTCSQLLFEGTVKI